MNTKSCSVLPPAAAELTARHRRNENMENHFVYPARNDNAATIPDAKTEGPERLLQLNPYPILDTDPSLNGSKFHRTSMPPRSMKGNKIINRQSAKYEGEPAAGANLEYLKNNEQSVNYSPVKKYDAETTPHVKYPPIQRRRKLIQTAPYKSTISTNSAKKTGDGVFPVTNGHQNGQNATGKNPADVPDRKIILNNAQMPSPAGALGDPSKVPRPKEPTKLKETIGAENDQGTVGANAPKRKIVPNESEEKEPGKLSDKNIKRINMKMKRGFSSANSGTSANPTNSLNNNYMLNSSTENTGNNWRPSVARRIHKKVEESVIDDNPNNKLTMVNHSIAAHSLSLPLAPKHNFERHSALRPSLFSNVPPYIRFSSFEIKGESFPLVLQKFLKWKLSSVTPIVVRRTIENSGFKLVRSEHSLNNKSNTNDPSLVSLTHATQPTPNAISLQKDCVVTPPIVDDFCGAVSQPNELMMLPRSQSNDWVGTWGTHMKSIYFKTLCDQQKFNHFPGTFQIGRKDRLWRNLHKLMVKYGKDLFGFIPKSYILPQETLLLRHVLEKNVEDKWIIKPPASARGSGIRVISKWNEIPKNVSLVVQRYIDNPYLINDTKFDLRLYILITSINPLRLYLYDNGLVRFASVKYSSDINTISDRYMHLTNYSINRLSSQYTQNQDANACQGHKWTLRSLWTYMENERKIDVKKLWDSLADLMVKTVISGELPMNQHCVSNLGNRYNAYELFGIDVLFDEYLKPWILEVNISPSLHSSSKLDLAVKGPLIKDVMNMVGYHIPDKMSASTHNSLLKVLGFNSPLIFDKRLYTLDLSDSEREKHEYYTNIESRENYIDSILDELLPDDIRHLIIYEDELSQVGSFKKVFPTTTTHRYHQFFESPRYYNMLFDAWENKYADNREDGIALLENLCQLKVHLDVPEVEEVESENPGVFTDQIQIVR